ncbi:hypothetical protein BB559_005590 [Furculomyces boomerangus]|uniref:sn-1-specific diacylglycerol lipase n=1 Tax=Furculomyces boomerangus TaxID=61424 RepID=A0A2T9Y7R5_9FUNG|nr:hypothetical protein BB559_005590 [Furculomyces boomerangus]
MADEEAFKHPSNLYRVPDGVMQIFVKFLKVSQKIKKCYVIVSFNDQAFQTSTADNYTCEWYEGFEFRISYHQQLFGNLLLEVYENNVFFPNRLVGKAEMKISMLEGYPEVFTSNFELMGKNTASTDSKVEKENLGENNIGYIQVRINYRFQKKEDPEPYMALNKKNLSTNKNSSNETISRKREEAIKSIGFIFSSDELTDQFSSHYNICFDEICLSEELDNTKITKIATQLTLTVDNTTQTLAETSERGLENSNSPQKAKVEQNNWLFDLFSPSETNSTNTQSAQNSSETTEIEKSLGKQQKDKNTKDSFDTETSVPKMISMFTKIWTTLFQYLGLTHSQLIHGGMQMINYQTDPDYSSMRLHSSSSTPIPPKELELPARYSGYALASYGWRMIYFFSRGVSLLDGTKTDSDINSVLQFLKLDRKDIIKYNFDGGKIFIPCYFVCHDRKNDAVVLTVRGTLSTEDLIVDLTCAYEKWHGGLIHSGVISMAQWLFVNVLPSMLAYSHKNKINKIYIVGHSLGGAAASTLLLLIKFNKEQLAKAGIPIEDFNFVSFGYGSLPSVSLDIANDSTTDNDNSISFSNFSINTFVHNRDMIPSLSYGSVADLKNIILPAYDNSETFSESIALQFEDKVEKRRKTLEKYTWLAKLQKRIMDSSENTKLYVPGKIFHIVYEQTHTKPPIKSEITKILAPHLFDYEESPVDDANAKLIEIEKTEPKTKPNKILKYQPTYVYKISRESLSMIEFCLTMVSDHIASAYEDAFLGALSTESQDQSQNQPNFDSKPIS